MQKHARARSVSVRVERTGERVRLEVTDDGAGVADEERARRRAEGHVGLSLLDELAAAAGGRLQVRSAPGSGTTFSMELPAP